MVIERQLNRPGNFEYKKSWKKFMRNIAKSKDEDKMGDNNYLMTTVHRCASKIKSLRWT
jgi:hypothetical protein